MAILLRSIPGGYSPKFLYRSGEKAIRQICKRVVRSKNHILVACFPKSGSTFLVSAIKELTGYRLHGFVYSNGGRNEQDLYLPRIMLAFRDTVTQQHVRATEDNLDIIRDFSIKPVVLVRNIFDVVISIHDHFQNESTAVPIGFVTSEFFKFDLNERLNFIIDLILPWYFYFYASWFEASTRGLINPLWMTYEEMMADKRAVLNKILEYCGIKKSDEEISGALARAARVNTRLNKGISGRGLEHLTDKQREKITNLANYYPWIDFSRIGIVGGGDRVGL